MRQTTPLKNVVFVELKFVLNAFALTKNSQKHGLIGCALIVGKRDMVSELKRTCSMMGKKQTRLKIEMKHPTFKYEIKGHSEFELLGNAIKVLTELQLMVREVDKT